MLTRRQLLVSAAVLGLPVAAAARTSPDLSRGRLSLGLLQSREPFIDPQDIAGSRARAFNAYRVLIQRSLDQQGALDWLAGGAFPLSGPGPFPEPVLKQLALTDSCTEVASLAALARNCRLRLTLGAWWQETGTGAVPRLLVFDGSGQYRTQPPPGNRACDGMQLHMPAWAGVQSMAALAAQCRRQARYGVRIEMLRGPAAPPGARPAMSGGSAIIGPHGKLIAHAGPQAETCVTAEVYGRQAFRL